MKKIILLIMIVMVTGLWSEFITYDKVIKNLKGVHNYEKGDYSKADEYFNENSLNNPDDGLLHFNRGTSLYKNGELENAEDEFNMALRDKEFSEKSAVYQNLGNLKFQEKEYKDAIKYYRQSLIENPDNLDARYNYELASRFLQQQQEQQQNQQQNDNDENKEDQQNKQNQENQQNKQDQENKEQQKQEQQNQQEQQQQEQEQQQQQQPQTKEEQEKKDNAEKILNTLAEKEKKAMKEKIQKKLQGQKPKSGKYW